MNYGNLIYSKIKVQTLLFFILIVSRIFEHFLCLKYIFVFWMFFVDPFGICKIPPPSPASMSKFPSGGKNIETKCVCVNVFFRFCKIC